MNLKKVALSTLAFFFSSFIIQGLLGFLFAKEYFASISIMRNPPIFYFGMSATILTGIAFAILYPIANINGTPALRGLKFGLLTGLLMVPFVALDIPGRFAIPSAGTWIVVQGMLGTIHFALAGVLTGLIYGKAAKEG